MFCNDHHSLDHAIVLLALGLPVTSFFENVPTGSDSILPRNRFNNTHLCNKIILEEKPFVRTVIFVDIVLSAEIVLFAEILLFARRISLFQQIELFLNIGIVEFFK